MRTIFKLLAILGGVSVTLLPAVAAPDPNLAWCEQHCRKKPCAVGRRLAEPIRYCVRLFPGALRAPRAVGVTVNIRIYNASPELESAIQKAIEDH